MSKTKPVWESSSWDELRSQVEFSKVLAALKAYDRSKAYHKTYNQRRNEILRKAKAAGITA
jgi:hypothetical protein